MAAICERDAMRIEVEMALTKDRNWYKPLWIGFACLIVCIVVGYAIGTKVAVNALFNTWMIVTGVPATINMVRFKDFKAPGAAPALVTWIAWFCTLIVLGVFVFGSICPGARGSLIPLLGTPGVK